MVMTRRQLSRLLLALLALSALLAAVQAWRLQRDQALNRDIAAASADPGGDEPSARPSCALHAPMRKLPVVRPMRR